MVEQQRQHARLITRGDGRQCIRLRVARPGGAIAATKQRRREHGVARWVDALAGAYDTLPPCRRLGGPGERVHHQHHVVARRRHGALKAIVHANGIKRFASLEVRRRGLDEDVARWARDVAASGDRVKLLASVQRVGEQLIARIEPTRVAANDAWAQVDGPFNRIVVESRSAGALVFKGPGAGGLATAGAVLSDLLPLLA